ncbi:YqiA/YcfP family alpha/beta fold hydrolase [uncultured Deefgea sp.]|uniref:YqiA/YcfP family alpha/beta fold hydrolase n=1 Tax=uncultured Deefgea sp. TaxID=1304914 RepID=UPI00261C29FF|nr:YqiA/YcfP family alpha/beta fold hydrolase [uncultured Deefgea sp.]
MKLIFLHGFLSSPLSQKAQDTAQWMREQGLSESFICPTIPMEPLAAAQMLRDLLTPLAGDFCLVGSSLGGFFATWAVETLGGRAVLVNPAVQPYHLIAQYLGEQKNYQTGEIHHIDLDFADKLCQLERRPTDLNRYWLLTQTADEVLDYRDAVQWYAGCRQNIISGGDHSFVDYPHWLAQIWAFANQGPVH